MKRLLLSLAAVAGLTGLLQAQAPSGFSYQAALRNSSGQALANQNVSLRFTIRDASTSGSILYQETQSKTTNAQGLVNCTVGTGTVGLGSYPSAAQLSSGLKFLQVEIDPVGGASYAEVSNTQIVSVPYANYANAAGTASSATTATSATSATTAGTANALNPSATVGISQLTAGGASAGQVLKWNGSAWVPSADDNTVLTAGTGVTITSGVINTPWTISGNDIYNNNTGNVGIGTSNPQSPFHLKGAGQMGRLEFSGSNAFGDWLAMYHKNTYIGYLGNYNDTNGLDFGTSGSGTKVNLVTGAIPRLTVSGSQVGIGTTTPTTMSKLHVNGFGTSGTAPYYQAIIVADGASPSVSSSGIYSTAGWRGVFGHNLGTANGYQAIGVYGLQEGRKYSIGYGVLGEIKGNGPTTYGVYGQSDSGSLTSIGVYGISNSRVSGFSAGVYGKGTNTGVYATSGGVGRSYTSSFITIAPALVAQQRGVSSGRQIGAFVHGVINGSSSHSALLVGADSSTTSNYAIETYARSYNNTTASNYAVYAVVGGGSTSASYAGYFSGAIYANSASSSIKSFKIDHPLDPENKYLYHSSVESPDMMNIYNGNVVTDANGDATVTLPNYFSALNIDFKYQLTCIGQFAQAIVAEEISEGTFKIKTDKPNVKVSWQVTGVRNDAVAQKYRLQPEVEKPQSEKGFYLIPEAYGYGPERNAAWYNSSRNTELKYPVKTEVPQVKPARNENNQP